MSNLKLLLSFLESTEKGSSTNYVVFCKSTIKTFSDASKAGMGGFSSKTDAMWRHSFIEEERTTLTLNCKKYIGSALNMDYHIEIDPDPSPFMYMHNMTNRSTVMGWLCKSNHDLDNAPFHNKITRFHIDNILIRQACNFS